MASLHVSLSDKMRSFVEDRIRGGEYHNHSEYVRDLIRRDQRRRAREKVDALLLEGLSSGEARPLNAEDWQAIREEVRLRAARHPVPSE